MSIWLFISYFAPLWEAYGKCQKNNNINILVFLNILKNSEKN